MRKSYEMPVVRTEEARRDDGRANTLDELQEGTDLNSAGREKVRCEI